MRSVLFDGDASQLVDDLEVRDPVEGEVIVRMQTSGLCQSDLSLIDGKYRFPMPVALGHEGAGVVDEVGPGVTGRQVGDHVITSTLASCGLCVHCTAGRPTMCRQSFGRPEAPFRWRGRDVHNFAALSTFTERIVVRAGQAVPIPKDVPLGSACVIGCAVLTGAGAVLNRARVGIGDRVVVVGTGGVGLNSLQAARIAGATTIVAVDTNPEKEKTARRFGATEFVNAAAGGSLEAVREATAGGADHVFDCVGAPATLLQGLEMLDWGGQLVLVGVPAAGTEYTLPSGPLYLDRSVMGCRYGSSRPAADIARYIELYRSGRLLLDELVTESYTYDDFDRMVQDARAGRLDRGVLAIDA